MATISYTAEYNLAARHVKVEWSSLANGDDGQPFDCSGLTLATLHVWGGGTGELKIQISNEIAPSNFVTWDSLAVPQGQQYNREETRWGSVRPLFENASGVTNVAMIFVLPLGGS